MRHAGDDHDCCCWKDHLTTTQVRIITLVAAGLSNEQIGHRIHLSHHTVTRHLFNAMRRLDTGNRAETVARCYACGILRADEWPPAATSRRCIDRRDGWPVAELTHADSSEASARQ